MKKILLPLLLFPVLAVGNGTNDDQGIVYFDNKMICVHSEVMYHSLNEYGEKPLLHMISQRKLNDGVNENINSYPTIMFVNPNTGSWTLVEKHTENILCVVTIGQQLKPYSR